MQYKAKNRIHLELFPTITSRDELRKLSGQRTWSMTCQIDRKNRLRFASN